MNSTVRELWRGFQPFCRPPAVRRTMDLYPPKVPYRANTHANSPDFQFQVIIYVEVSGSPVQQHSRMTI